MNQMKRLLIVDDEPELGLLLSFQFLDLGFEVKIAQSLAEGAEAMAAFAPDLILLDLNLPDGLGFSLVPVARERYPDVKIVIISAYGESFNPERAKELGISAFFPKPFVDDGLINWVQNQNGISEV